MSGQRTRRSASRLRSTTAHNLFATIPIVLAGSMAVGLGVTGPIDRVAPKRAEKPKTTPADLAKPPRSVITSTSAAEADDADSSSAASAADSSSVDSTTTPAAMTTAAAPMTYTVVAGDTVSSIAGRYGLATASVLALNGLSWKSVIFPGQRLKLSTSGTVPVAAATAAAAASPSNPNGTRYTIRSGDTIGAIASRFGVSTQTLLSANGLGWSSIIYPGQTIAIPASITATAFTATPVVAVTPSVPVVSQATSYVIQPGDTISGIAAKFGVTPQALQSANGLSPAGVIYAGHRLTVPGATAIVLASSTTSILTPEMSANASTIIQIGRSLGVPDYGIVIALAAALQESGLRNLNYGDRDSLGVFQQRPSAGWGTAAQLLNPSYAARLFYGGPQNPNKGNTKGLLDIAGWQSKTVTQAAQAVQHSAYPDAYAKWEATARTALADLG